MTDKITSATWRQCNVTSFQIPGGVCVLILFSSLRTTLKVKSDKFLPEILWSDCLKYCAQNESTVIVKEDLVNYFPLLFYFTLIFLFSIFILFISYVK